MPEMMMASTREAGLTDYYPSEVVVRRTIVAHTAKSYVLADSSKLGVIAVRRVCQLDQLTAILTDDVENPEASAALAAEGVTLLQAEVRKGRDLPAAV
jgi:DeoR/GlpR family transcriptional regulator of sugar metabolism